MLVFALSSCVSRIEKHGYMFDMSGYDLLQAGVTSKDRVERLMGSPTLVFDFGGEELWIYYSEDVKHFLFFDPKISNRRIVTIAFDQNGVINKLNSIGLEVENKELVFADKTTEVSDHERGLIKSFFSNVGQVRPVQ